MRCAWGGFYHGFCRLVLSGLCGFRYIDGHTQLAEFPLNAQGIEHVKRLKHDLRQGAFFFGSGFCCGSGFRLVVKKHRNGGHL